MNPSNKSPTDHHVSALTFFTLSANFRSRNQANQTSKASRLSSNVVIKFRLPKIPKKFFHVDQQMTQLRHDLVNDSFNFYFQLQRQFNIHTTFPNWTTTKTTIMDSTTTDSMTTDSTTVTMTTAITTKNHARKCYRRIFRMKILVWVKYLVLWCEEIFRKYQF